MVLDVEFMRVLDYFNLIEIHETDPKATEAANGCWRDGAVEAMVEEDDIMADVIILFANE